MNYYHRQIQLWGEETQERLESKKIAIIGSGGLGSSVGIALSGSGIGEIYCIDFDTVATHNIHRQIAFVAGDEGRDKAEVLAELINNRNPYIKAIPIVKTFEAFTSMDINVDLIIDATDNLPSRAAIDSYAKSTNTPWIYGSVEAFNGQVCFFDKASFNDSFKVSDHKPAGIAAPIVMQIASFQANLALRYLADLPIQKDKLHFLYYNNVGELIMQKFGVSS